MTTPSADQSLALAPVRAELLRAARADAEALLGEARREAAAILGKARADAAAILAEARRQGDNDGASAAAADLTRARREARARQLAIRNEACTQLRRRVVDGVRELRSAESYPAIRDCLQARARRLLGPDASIAESPGGGVVGVAPGRRVDLTLDTLAARALDRLGVEVETLWAP